MLLIQRLPLALRRVETLFGYPWLCWLNQENTWSYLIQVDSLQKQLTESKKRIIKIILLSKKQAQLHQILQHIQNLVAVSGIISILRKLTSFDRQYPMTIIIITDNINQMASPGSKIQRMLSRPITQLMMFQKKLPNRQVLKLYRDVYKYAGKMDWCNQKGDRWTDILRRSARKQFDLSKDETDPFLIMKMMVTTRQCMMQLDDRMVKAQTDFVKNVEETKNYQQDFIRVNQGRSKR